MNAADTSGPLVLGIETSCDETGVGLVRGHALLADAVASSVAEHARFGGVVPEVASRAHLEAMVPTIERACATGGVRLREVEFRHSDAAEPLLVDVDLDTGRAKVLAPLLTRPVGVAFIG